MEISKTSEVLSQFLDDTTPKVRIYTTSFCRLRCNGNIFKLLTYIYVYSFMIMMTGYVFTAFSCRLHESTNTAYIVSYREAIYATNTELQLNIQ